MAGKCRPLKQTAVCFIDLASWEKTTLVLKAKHQHLWSSSSTNCLHSLRQVNAVSLSFDD